MSIKIGILLLIVITILSAVIIYIWITRSIEERLHREPASAINLKVEAFKVTSSGGVLVYVRNIASTSAKIDAIYLIQGSNVALVKRSSEIIKAGEVKLIIIDSLSLRRVTISGVGKCYIKLASVEGPESNIVIPSHIIASALERKPALIGLQAIVSSSHWIALDYSSGHYKLYGDYGPGISQRTFITEGNAPIITNTNEYTISTSWVSWDQKPVNSPVLIVVNPTKASQDWIFTWKDPHGIHKFYLENLRGDIEIDFLIFWEDIYYPPTTPSLDDWKDHVIRITVFTNGTYRIAVYMAKGGYSHKFYLGIQKPYENIPDQVDKLVYTKPFGAYWRNKVGNYYREMSDKVYRVTIGS